MSATEVSEQDALDENKLIAQRRDKLNQIRAQGIAFPNDFRRNAVAGDLHTEYGEMDATELETRQRSRQGGRSADESAGHGQGQFLHICRT